MGEPCHRDVRCRPETPADDACALPLFSPIPLVGVQAQASTLRGLVGAGTGAYLGPHGRGTRPPWLATLEFTAAWALNVDEPVQLALGFTASRLFRLSETFELGAGPRVMLHQLTTNQLAAGFGLVAQWHFVDFLVRGFVAAEWELRAPPTLSAAGIS